MKPDHPCESCDGTGLLNARELCGACGGKGGKQAQPKPAKPKPRKPAA